MKKYQNHKNGRAVAYCMGTGRRLLMHIRANIRLEGGIHKLVWISRWIKVWLEMLKIRISLEFTGKKIFFPLTPFYYENTYLTKNDVKQLKVIWNKYFLKSSH